MCVVIPEHPSAQASVNVLSLKQGQNEAKWNTFLVAHVVCSALTQFEILTFLKMINIKIITLRNGIHEEWYECIPKAT
jgi:hypothetical protein